jgi:molybdopterin/thiamine biosynthesis adenylyltransferase
MATVKIPPVLRPSVGGEKEVQATEVVKLVTGAGEPLVGRLLLYEALGATFTELKVRRDPECPICSKDPSEISDEEMGVFPDYEAFCAAAG